MGGCWFCRFGRIVDWSRVASLVREMLDAVDEMLACLFDTLGLLKTAPVRVCPGCDCGSCCEACRTGARAVAPLRNVLGLSTIVVLSSP